MRAERSVSGKGDPRADRRVDPAEVVTDVPVSFGRLLLASVATSVCTVMALIAVPPVEAGPSGQQDLTTPEGLYRAGCASCHGADGSGADTANLGFDVPLPDFTDCGFATREPDADWFAVTHQGGPVRGFADNMPAYAEAFSDEQIRMTIEHVRTFCSDDAWPRGELNFPRALVTEKAYPEDELVWTTRVDVEGTGAVVNELLYERRFGARNQLEVKVPFGLREVPPAGEWNAGVGDLVIGAKRVVAASLQRGAILAVGGEVVLPTGDASIGLGADTVLLEPFASAGLALTTDGFLHLQAGAELSTDTAKADHEAFWRAVLGTTLVEGRFGRSWSPMVEILGTSELEDDATDHRLDLLPQVQVSLNTRQHVLANVGVRIPVTDAGRRSTQLLVYLLWEWFDGGFLDGW